MVSTTRMMIDHPPELKHPVAIIAGTTASGKSNLAMEFCDKHPNVEIINGDSIQVYQGFDIGSAKPSIKDRATVAHHLINICHPSENFTAGDFYSTVYQTIEDIHERGHRALIVGGTGFYLKALVYGLWNVPKVPDEKRKELLELSNEELMNWVVDVDPEYSKNLALNDRYRLIRACEIIAFQDTKPSELKKKQNTSAHPDLHYFVIDREKSELEKRIQKRTQSMLEKGFLSETQALFESFPESKPLQSVGYAQCVQFLHGNEPQGRRIAPGLDGLYDEICLATNQLVKKQRTWFKSEKSAQSFMMDQDQQTIWEKLKEVYD